MERPRERFDPGVFPGASSRGDPDCPMAKKIKKGGGNGKNAQKFLPEEFQKESPSKIL